MPDTIEMLSVKSISMHNDVTKKETRIKRKVIFFGCPLDCDERDESIQEKHACMGSSQGDDDPYSFVMEFIRKEVDPGLWSEIGSMDVPEWLRPMPSQAQKEYVIVDNFVGFIDENECLTCAKALGDIVKTDIYPNIPCMIAVDHSMSGGIFRSLAEQYDSKEISLVVLDSHTDALPTSILSGAIRYDIETNPNTVHDPNDPFLTNRPESFNASSFLYHLLEEGVVAPENLYIIGVSDYPPKRSFRIKDPRIKRYAGLYSGLKNKGVKLLTKKDLLNNSSKLSAVLSKIETSHVYISIDMDIGARNALGGVRFQNWQGFNEKQIYRIVASLQKIISGGTQLAGMDLAEFNPRRAKSGAFQDDDRTYRIAANLIKILCFGIAQSE